jgi:hypothetical protein
MNVLVADSGRNPVTSLRLKGRTENGDVEAFLKVETNRRMILVTNDDDVDDAAFCLFPRGGQRLGVRRLPPPASAGVGKEK